jgi:hypothetical protein
MKISEFLIKKLDNFEQFIIEQLKDLQIPESNKDKLLCEITYYKQHINIFIPSIIKIAKYDIDNAVKFFLSTFDIAIEDIKDLIDYDKLKKYIEMFIDVVKNNIT